MISITFIIPVYNGEQYILRCIKSLLEISYPNIEILVINDGSTDRTSNIVEAISDERVKIISIDNSGVSAARNCGIKNATGTYVTFIDCDDLVNSCSYTRMLKEINWGRDMYMFGYEIVDNDSVSRVNLPKTKGIYDNYVAKKLALDLFDDKFSANYIASYFGGKVYQYLIKKQFLLSNNILFENKLHFAEDRAFCFNCFLQANSFEILEEYPYQYYVYDQSASHKYRPQLFRELKESYECACDLYGTCIGKKNELYYYYGNGAVNKICENYIKSRKGKKAAIAKIKEVLNDRDFQYALRNFSFSNWTLYEKILQLLYRCKCANLLYIFFKVKFLLKK